MQDFALDVQLQLQFVQNKTVCFSICYASAPVHDNLERWATLVFNSYYCKVYTLFIHCFMPLSSILPAPSICRLLEPLILGEVKEEPQEHGTQRPNSLRREDSKAVRRQRGGREARQTTTNCNNPLIERTLLISEEKLLHPISKIDLIQDHRTF